MNHVHCKECGISVDWPKGSIKPEYCLTHAPKEIELVFDFTSLFFGFAFGLVLGLVIAGLVVFQ